jgi:hypothetical protein
MNASQLSGGNAPQPKYIANFMYRMKRYNSSNSEAAERLEHEKYRNEYEYLFEKIRFLS